VALERFGRHMVGVRERDHAQRVAAVGAFHSVSHPVGAAARARFIEW
jgi:hypothetical protein